MEKENICGAQARVEEVGLFAAANGGRGFVSFYDKIFSDPKILRRYLLMGGPGTGKSSFMRRVADTAQREGFEVRFYRCSSDHSSLDAIVIENTVALLDATAPHTVEPELAGARDEIINLGQFWDSDMLLQKRGQIEALGIKKRDEYAGAYRFLEGALALDLRAREISSGFVKFQKLDSAVERAIGRIPRGDGYSCRVGIRRSIGIGGRARLEYYERAAKKLYAIEDYMGSAHIFLEGLLKSAARNENAVTISLDPLNCECLDAILFEESGTAFVVLRANETEKYSGKLEGTVNMKRFVKCSGLCESEKAQKREYRGDVRIRDGLVDSACECLQSAGRAHFLLEKLYGEAMDFDAESSFCQSFSANLCQKLKKLIK